MNARMTYLDSKGQAQVLK
ncbi:hypothetical protein KZH41_02770 [Pseudomonas sp. YeP6b]|nr:hypothetical protein KZH41_02770 [Pseudomonas sp. YeP6b]